MNSGFLNLLSSLVAVPLVTALLACGGGGSSSSPTPTTTPTPTPTVSGTVAAGAPITGIVFVKGANGATTNAIIDAAGHFSLDVSALTPNYLIYAEGLSGNKLWRIYSVATSTGTINVTPITNLVVANALGALPTSLFNDWNGTQVTANALATAKSTVNNSLSPMLNGMGVTTDLMTGSFTANHTGLDLVLDALNITWSGTTATVTNGLTGSSFANDVSNHGATATSLPAGDSGLTQSLKTDLDGIKVLTNALQTLRIQGISTQNDIDIQIGPLVAGDYFGGGMTKAQYLASICPNPPSAGIPDFKCSPSIVSPLPTLVLGSYLRGYWVRFVNSYAAGKDVTSTDTAVVTLDGTHWLIFGDLSWIGFKVVAAEIQQFMADGTVSMSTQLDLELSNNAFWATDQGVQSAIVVGPGLPAGGVILSISPSTTFFNYNNQGSGYTLDDTAIAAIPDNAIYTANLYSDAASTVSLQTSTPLQTYTTQLPGAAPIKNIDLKASLFPTITAPTSHLISAANIPGQFTATWSNRPDGLAVVISVDLYWQAQGGSSQQSVFAAPTNYGLGTQPLTLPVTTGSAVNAHLRLLSFDAYGRGYASFWYFQ